MTKNCLPHSFGLSSFKKGKHMRLLILSIFAAISLSSCPGSSANTSHGQMTATFSNVVGTPNNFSLTPFTATKVNSGSSSTITNIFGTEGNRVVLREHRA